MLWCQLKLTPPKNIHKNVADSLVGPSWSHLFCFMDQTPSLSTERMIQGLIRIIDPANGQTVSSKYPSGAESGQTPVKSDLQCSIDLPLAGT